MIVFRQSADTDEQLVFRCQQWHWQYAFAHVRIGIGGVVDIVKRVLTMDAGIVVV